VADDLHCLSPRWVIHAGAVVAREGRYQGPAPMATIPPVNTVRLGPVLPEDFGLRVDGATSPVIGLVPGQIVTEFLLLEVSTCGGWWQFEPDRDVALIASLERHRATGHHGLGLVRGFGLRRPGALGSTVAHDSHNVIVAGSGADQMLVCVRRLQELGGGFVVVADGRVAAELPLPIAGLISPAGADEVCRQLRQVRAAAAALGCPLDCPFAALSFLALPVIPELRITTRGIFHVTAQRRLEPRGRGDTRRIAEVVRQ
jgi:adenine deaminase